MCKRIRDYQTGENHLFDCSEAEKMGDKFYHAKDFFSGMLEMLYGKKEFDRNSLENYIGEVCHAFNIKEPIEPLAIISNGLRGVKNV